MAESNDKVNMIISKVAVGAITLFISVASVLYTNDRQRISSLEEKVSYLQQDKVSRQEFREEMSQLRSQNDANKSDILARQESMKSDILARIDLIIPRLVNTNRGE